MLSTAKVDWWKCLIFFLGSLRIEKRAQMSRVARDYSGQRLSFLLVALASAAALALFRKALESNEITNTIARWFHERAQMHEPTQDLPQMFQLFQDDLLEVAVGEQAK